MPRSPPRRRFARYWETHHPYLNRVGVVETSPPHPSCAVEERVLAKDRQMHRHCLHLLEGVAVGEATCRRGWRWREKRQHNCYSHPPLLGFAANRLYLEELPARLVPEQAGHAGHWHCPVAHDTHRTISLIAPQ